MTDNEPQVNALGQPVGPLLHAWSAPPLPARTQLQGRTCRLEPLDAQRHGDDLWEAFARDATGALWTYLPIEPPTTRPVHDAWVTRGETSSDPLHFAVVDASGRAVGVIAYLRINPADGVIEVGYVTFSPLLQRTVAATETQFLMAEHAFSLGYRRYEWKCDALNAPSRSAALRLGFTFEGLFRKDRIVKGRSRDTAWFSVTDDEWPVVREAYARWLDPANFDGAGRQVRRLAELRDELSAGGR